MTLLIVAAFIALMAAIIIVVVAWDEPTLSRRHVVKDNEGTPLYATYRVRIYGRTYPARRYFIDETTFDRCPYCGGVVKAHEEDVWLGGHSSYYLVYTCDECGHSEEDEFGEARTQRVESPDLEYEGAPPERREFPQAIAMGVFAAMAVVGSGIFVASRFFTIGSSWVTGGICAFLCAIVGAAFVDQAE